MTTKSMLIITDADGKVIAAQIDDAGDGGVTTYISPAHPEHTLHRLYDVPAHVHGHDHPEKFRTAIHEHIQSGSANIVRTTVEEVHAAASRKAAQASVTASSAGTD